MTESAPAIENPDMPGETWAVIFLMDLFSHSRGSSVTKHTLDCVAGLRQARAAACVLDLPALGWTTRALHRLCRMNRTSSFMTSSVGAVLMKAIAWMLGGFAHLQLFMSQHRSAACLNHPCKDCPVDLARSCCVARRSNVVAVLSSYDLTGSGLSSALVRPFLNALLMGSQRRRFLLAVNLFTETTALTESLVAELQTVDHIWVPSRWHANVIRQAGLQKPGVLVLPSPVNTDVFVPRRQAQRKRTPTFRFLTVICHDAPFAPDWQTQTRSLWVLMRKCPDLVLTAFLDEFSADEPVRLYIKSLEAPSSARASLRRFLKDLDVDIDRRRQVVALGGWISDAAMAGLYQSADVVVLASRGEGWGRPLTEAMACGAAVIGTPFAGATEFLNEATGFPVEFSIEPVSSTFGPDAAELGDWATPSYESLRKILRATYSQPAERAIRSRVASEMVHTRFTSTAVGRQLITDIKNLAEA